MISLTLLCLCLALTGAAQDPQVGVIDFYGLHRVTEADLRRVLPFKEGELLSAPSSEVERRLRSVPGVATAHITGVCCNDGKAVLYIGIEETGSAAAYYHVAPTGRQQLPAALAAANADFTDAMAAAVGRGDTQEDTSTGHALARDPVTRAAQERMVALVAGNIAVLRDVLRSSARADSRAASARMLAYAADEQAVVPDLVAALRDPDEDVRANALRSLSVMAGYAQASREAGLVVPWEPLVDMLNSPDWTDRNMASVALMDLSGKRAPALLALLRDRARDSLVEMTRWKTDDHAMAGFWLLGRAFGMPERTLANAWKHRDREAVIQAALAGGKDAPKEAGR